MSQGLVTGVANGSATVTATYPAYSLTGTTTVNVGSFTLTSATPNALTQGATSQNIALVGTGFVTGQTAVFSNAGITVNSTTVNSSTSITANVTVSGSATTGAGTVKVHDGTLGDSNTQAFTVNASTNYDTTSYNATTGAGIFGSSGSAPQTFDAANQYASSAAFRANVSSGISTFSGSGGGTGNSSSLYNDGVYSDLIAWQTSVQYGGQSTWQSRLVGQTNVGASAPKPILRTNQSALGSCEAGWLVVRRYYPSGWTSTGDATPGSAGATFNVTQAAGYKSGPFAGPGGGRGGLLNTGSNWLEENVSGGIGGLTESGTGASIGNEWTDGAWYDYAVHLQQLTGTNGHQYFGVTCWRRKIGDAEYTRLGYRRTEDVGAGSIQYWTNLSIFGENYNQARATDLYIYDWGWAMWNDTSNSDPLGILAYDDTLTPAAATISNVTGQTGSSATFTVGVSRYSASIVPVVDSVEITAQAYPLPPEIPECDPTTNSGYLTTPCPVSRTVTGLSAGTHTISFNVYNGDGTASVNTGNKSVTI